MRVVDKNKCAICGDKLLMFKNVDLQDGRVCSNCANKRSKYLSKQGLKHMSIFDFQKHLNARVENVRKLRSFKPSTSVGKNWRIVADEIKQQFIICKGGENYMDSNPEIFDYTDILDFKFDIQKRSRELNFYDTEFNYYSFSPACYNISFVMDGTLYLNNELGSVTFQYPEVEDRTISRQLSSFKGLPPEEARKHAKKMFPGFAGKTNNEDSVKHTTDYINNFEELKQLEAFFKNILNKDHIETCQFCGVPVVDKTITNCPCCGGVALNKTVIIR